MSRARKSKAAPRRDMRIARPGDLVDEMLAVGEVRRLNADLHVLTGIVADLRKELVVEREDRRSLNLDVSRALRSASAHAAYLDEHERRIVSIDKRLDAHAMRLGKLETPASVDVKFDDTEAG
jgi:hypothetical protein